MADKDRTNTGSTSTGAGAEAAEGEHAAQQGGRDPGAKSSLEGREAASTNMTEGTEGSQPLTRTYEHEGGYGGKGGEPRTSSDTREPPLGKGGGQGGGGA